ncbi:hypothetical protein [Jeotgalibaca caeni]|uniref:hypothetical protein n=1 Tax=Jeotgalibaca caeni TaxID=3028623 RepID=UPI00237D435A|nr:hypothetical protein [Jeotgalibaca caeni]MDE1548911.1 hypothetical protein [Jeotgalibaca caeni]
MEFYMKLPRNKKEFVIFLLTISIISVHIIAPLITFFEVGFHFYVWLDVLTILPFIWITVIALVLLTHKPAEWLSSKIADKNDRFRSQMVINTLCTVLLMSVFLTVIGSWIGARHISMDPIRMFFYKWPRNMAISFLVEAVIAQPIARFVMLKMHQAKDKKTLAEQ